MNPRELIESRQMFVVNYLQQMSASTDQLNHLIKHDNIVNEIFHKFLQDNVSDQYAMILFDRFNIAKRILRSPELLYDEDLITRFFEICPTEYWRNTLRTEFTLYSPQEGIEFDLLPEFRDVSFNQLLLSSSYELFRYEIFLITTRIMRIMHEVHSSINRFRPNEQIDG